jgi:transposase-like protein
MSGGHAVPFYCPYCGDEDLRPVGDAGTWWCQSCRRAWTLRYVGTGKPDELTQESGAEG